MNVDRKILPITIGLVHQDFDALSAVEYRELDFFRRHLEQEQLGPVYQPYQAHKKQALCYQLAFGTLGLLFLCFCTIFYTKNMNWAYSLFFTDTQFLKSVLYIFCGSLSAIAFWVASQIRPEKEAIANLKKRTRQTLRKIYHERISAMGVKRFLPRGKYQQQTNAVKHHFHNTWDNVDHAISVTQQLISAISTSKILSPDMRVKLFNQAILELQDKLHTILQSYR